MAELKLHERVLKLAPSATLAMAAKAKALADKGIKVSPLGAGEPDFLTPAPIMQAVAEAMKQDVGHYTAVRGTDALLSAIVEKFKRDQKLQYGLDQVMSTVGAKSAIAMAIESVAGPGDEVIVFAPFWVSYPEQIRLVGAKPVIVESRVSHGFLPTAESLRAAITPRTKAVILNSPNNPSGAVYPRALLAELMDVLKGSQIWVISDEIYEHLLYDNAEHVSPAALSSDAFERTVVISGASKGYAMTGWRVGVAGGPKDIIAAMTKLQSQRDTCLPGITQAAAAYAFREPEALKVEMAKMRDAYQARRDRALELLSHIKGLACHRPKGAFYALIDVAEVIGQPHHGSIVEDDVMLAIRLLEEAHVATVPGTPFGVPGTIRISLASSMEDIEEGIGKIAAWLQ